MAPRDTCFFSFHCYIFSSDTYLLSISTPGFCLKKSLRLLALSCVLFLDLFIGDSDRNFCVATSFCFSFSIYVPFKAKLGRRTSLLFLIIVKFVASRASIGELSVLTPRLVL